MCLSFILCTTCVFLLSGDQCCWHYRDGGVEGTTAVVEVAAWGIRVVGALMSGLPESWVTTTMSGGVAHLQLLEPLLFSGPWLPSSSKPAIGGQWLMAQRSPASSSTTSLAGSSKGLCN